MLYLLYFLLSLVSLPCLVIVVETWIKAFVMAIMVLFGIDVEVKIMSASYIADLIS